jgi:methyl-accepting chemotaxis protein
MSKGDLDRLTRRVHLLGFLITLPVFLVISVTSVLLYFHFNARMFAWFWIATGISVAVLLVPYVVAIRVRFHKVRRVLEQARDDSSGAGASLDPRDLLCVERYPVYMGVTAFIVLTTGVIIGALTFYFFAGFNGWISILYFVVETCEALTCAYLQAYIIYWVMDPARRMVYDRYGLPHGVTGISLKARLAAMAVLFIMVPLIISWVASASIYIFQTHSDLKEHGQRNAEILSIMVEQGSTDGDYALPLAGTTELALTGNEVWLLLDRQGEIAGERSIGKGVGQEEMTKLLEKLASVDGSGAVLNERLDLIAAAAPVGSTGYRVVEVFPLAPYQEASGTILGLFAILAAFILILGALLARLTSDSVTIPMHDLEEAAGKVAEGDLTVQVSVSAADEVGHLTYSFGNMVGSLHHMSTESLEAAEETSEGATGVSATTEEFQASLEQLTGVIENLAENASSESKMADRVYALIGEIYKALESSSAQADEGVVVSHTSSELAEGGKKDAIAAVERMGSVKDSITETAGIIGRLDEQISEIGVIVEVIDNIADQTNLLSLNAAIEAARAQEHGRGFSVVAEEVKKLAEESARSTSRIAGLVREIQRNTSVAVQATERGTMEVDAGAQAVQVAGESLEKIYEFVKKAEGLSRTVAETTREHLGLIEQGIGAMEDIRNIAEQNASSSEEIAAAAEEQAASMQELSATSQQLASLAERLKETASQYKL